MGQTCFYVYRQKKLCPQLVSMSTIRKTYVPNMLQCLSSGRPVLQTCFKIYHQGDVCSPTYFNVYNQGHVSPICYNVYHEGDLSQEDMCAKHVSMSINNEDLCSKHVLMSIIRKTYVPNTFQRLSSGNHVSKICFDVYHQRDLCHQYLLMSVIRRRCPPHVSVSIFRKTCFPNMFQYLSSGRPVPPTCFNVCHQGDTYPQQVSVSIIMEAYVPNMLQCLASERDYISNMF